MENSELRIGRLYLIAIMGAVALIAVAHHLIPHSSLLWHNFFQWLYYVPVIIGAIRFGLRGGVLIALAAGVGYLPHLVAAPKGYPADYVLVQYAAVFLLLTIGTITGLLADRERERRRQLQLTTGQLQHAHEELRQSFDQLRRADRLSSVGQLAAGLAHEIRNPLASIRGAVDVLDNERSPEKLRAEFRGIVKRETRRLEQLLTNLLDFARPSEPKYTRVPIEQLLAAVTTLVGKTADRHRVKVRVDVAPGIPSLECDPDQLRQVFLNLLLNAIQAMPDGGEIVVAARRSGGNLIVDVIDEGSGIEGDTERIFDPFFTTKENGTGLGLAVVRRIIEQHDGEIRAEPNEGGGATFSVTLPVERPVGQEIPSEPNSGQKGAGRRAGGVIPAAPRRPSSSTE